MTSAIALIGLASAAKFTDEACVAARSADDTRLVDVMGVTAIAVAPSSAIPAVRCERSAMSMRSLRRF